MIVNTACRRRPCSRTARGRPASWSWTGRAARARGGGGGRVGRRREAAGGDGKQQLRAASAAPASRWSCTRGTSLEHPLRGGHAGACQSACRPAAAAARTWSTAPTWRLPSKAGGPRRARLLTRGFTAVRSLPARASAGRVAGVGARVLLAGTLSFIGGRRANKTLAGGLEFDTRR